MDILIELNEALNTPIFYGVNNQNVIALKNLHPAIRVIARGYHIKASGSEEELTRFEEHVRKVEAFCLENEALTEEQVVDIVKGNEPNSALRTTQDLILHGVSGKPIMARTANQRCLVKDFAKNDLLFAIGPAGSGKTFTAIALAVNALKKKEVRKIILSRPAVEAGEKLGFLPGDMKDKIDPYLQPLYDALEEMVPAQKLQEYIDKGVIQIAPLAFMRGRTLSNAVVILDEAQNTTIPQLKMFLTRLGFGGKMIVTGDLTQIDLPASVRSGLRDAIERLEEVKGISIVHFNDKDIVRHPLVPRIIHAYNKE